MTLDIAAFAMATRDRASSIVARQGQKKISFELYAAFVSDQIWLQVSADGRSLFPCDPPPSPPPEVF
jgi:hypothetical protein